MKRFTLLFGALLLGATSLLAQINYAVSFSANVALDSVQVKNIVSGDAKMLYCSDVAITLQKKAKQGGTGTPIVSIGQSEFLQQTASNEVTVNMEKTGRLNLTLYSSNGTFVARYSNNVDAGQISFQIGASTGVYVLVASANNQTASLKILLTQSTQPSILEFLTSKPEPMLKSINDVITFDEGDTFEFMGYYYNQTDKKTAVITSDKTITFSFTKVTAPTVTTVEATDISFDVATIGGNVIEDNGAMVTERGVCWATTENPTILDNKTENGNGTGSFIITLSSLSEGTTYYVRAYAINAEGTSYGNLISFTTKEVTTPTITTVEANNVTIEAATIGGNVTEDNGASVTERGVCWATTENPTISDNKIESGTGIGRFTVTLSFSSFLEGTTYYVRAYAINAKGTSYGNAISFTMKNTVVFVNGVIQSVFSVSESQKVYFSQGNLQYQAREKIWRFAENQWDFVGTQKSPSNNGGTIKGSDNANISPWAYDGWIDLFGWGTSGYNGKQPTMRSASAGDYGAGTTDIAGTQYDWGVYNAISNGGDKKGMWRTLTKEEWSYVTTQRPNASLLYGTANVNGVNGLILLPDNWESPMDITFNAGFKSFARNTYTISEWLKMEANGAVFLPAAGDRWDQNVNLVSVWGLYWSATCEENDPNLAYYLTIQDCGGVGVLSTTRAYGLSVRLVQDLK